MKKKGTAAIAVLCGVVCAVSMLAYIGHVNERAQAQRNEALARFGGETAEVYVALQDIAAGEQASTINVTKRAWLVDLLPDDPVTDLSQVAGMQATSPVLAGEVVSMGRFSPSAERIAVPAGLQEVGVELGSAQAVGGTLEAGQAVDVYAAGTTGTKRIAQNVLVTAVGEGQAARQSVTLAVAAEQVEEIIAATQAATLYLTLPSKAQAGQKEREEDV